MLKGINPLVTTSVISAAQAANRLLASSNELALSGCFD
ncbi:hypothetical protein COO91_05638 [Nostoc flagelliforme CCNUN1]|uniref:Uncharacterized protein n=1 Tax=Nostoc flagelliforme CCNUN1 TaxID=2038116 RepID=A0A2K8SWB0_9NOSO|nr:hypothetical protein COO91_05638 [Nostoc flagelliforme CCNUN1]